MSSSIKIVLFTGAGTSASAGIPTFKTLADGNTLWGKYDVKEICSLEALTSNRDQVISFYNGLRKLIQQAQPTSFHQGVKEWQDNLLREGHELFVITQNIDQLFERAGVRRVTHIHGEITYARCLAFGHRWWIGYDSQSLDDVCPVCSELGEEYRPIVNQVRPDVVLFGEPTPAYLVVTRLLADLTEQDYLVICGTSQSVFPIASLYGTRARIIYNNIVEPSQMVGRIHKSIISPCEQALPDIINACCP